MKRLICFFIAIQIAALANAQDSVKKRSHVNYDADLPAWCFDLNLKGGMMMQDNGKYNLAGNYLNYISASGVGEIKYGTGMVYGADGQLAYFFGKSRHFGIGAGFMYLYQSFDVDLDKFRIEYQSEDSKNRVFRQIITANNPIKEKVTVTNMNIPVMLKYKNQFSKKWGFTMDAGILFNMQLTNKFTADNASFNYEAIYKYQVDGSGNAVAVYDNGVNPSSESILLTKAYITSKNPAASVADTFRKFYESGYNVGLDQKAKKPSDNISYKTGSIGFMVQPAVSYLLNDHIALNLGVFYAYQSFESEKSNSGYKVTENVGSYNSMLKTIKTSNQSNMGINLGLRYYFGKMKDKDGDGVADKRDDCPDIAGLKFFHGCPDRDGDSIIDNMDKCPDDKGLAKFQGCPDKDGDEIIDKDDECPDQPGRIELRGCPDRDRDGIADKNDACPDVKGLEAFHGCPDTDGDGISDNNDACPDKPGPAETNGCPDSDHDGVIDSKDKCPDVAGPASNDGCPETAKEVEGTDMVLFETGTAKLKKESFPILDKAVDMLKNDPGAVLTIDGYTDATGTDKINKPLSVARAKAVGKYFSKKGISAKRIVINGHGSNDPIDSNDTDEGRAKNRRVVMKLQYNNNK